MRVPESREVVGGWSCIVGFPGMLALGVGGDEPNPGRFGPHGALWGRVEFCLGGLGFIGLEERARWDGSVTTLRCL